MRFLIAIVQLALMLAGMVAPPEASVYVCRISGKAMPAVAGTPANRTCCHSEVVIASARERIAAFPHGCCDLREGKDRTAPASPAPMLLDWSYGALAPITSLPVPTVEPLNWTYLRDRRSVPPRAPPWGYRPLRAPPSLS